MLKQSSHKISLIKKNSVTPVFVNKFKYTVFYCKFFKYGTGGQYFWKFCPEAKLNFIPLWSKLDFNTYKRVDSRLWTINSWSRTILCTSRDTARTLTVKLNKKVVLLETMRTEKKNYVFFFTFWLCNIEEKTIMKTMSAMIKDSDIWSETALSVWSDLWPFISRDLPLISAMQWQRSLMWLDDQFPVIWTVSTTGLLSMKHLITTGYL